MVLRRVTGVAVAALLVAIVGSVSSAGATRQSVQCDPAAPETCLYVSDLSFTPGVVDDLELVDPDRFGYRVPLLVRYPIEASGPRPVVIWHHGGEPGPNARNRGEEWSETFARAGYVVIHPGRLVPQDVTPLLRACSLNGIADPNDCGLWTAQHPYGAENTHFVIDHLSEINLAVRGRIDPSKIVVAGHSAGTAPVLAAAGATQQWVPGGPMHHEEDDRPIAFLAAAPLGPTYAGFQAGFDEARSFVGITRPLLTITGIGDETGEPIPSRLTSWITSPGGNKPLVWDNEPEAVHTTMNIHKCDTRLREDHCDWLASVGLAYLDAVVRERPEAIEWFGSNAFETATGGAIQLIRR